MISVAIQASLPETRGKANRGLPNWWRSLAYCRPSSSALTATPTARAAVWMRALSKVSMSCLKPWPFDAAEEVGLGHPEAVEGERVLLHAAIAEDLDLAAGQAVDREGVGVGAARLLGQQHRQAAIALLVRVGADEQGHQVGAGGVGDPVLGAGDQPSGRPCARRGW